MGPINCAPKETIQIRCPSFENSLHPDYIRINTVFQPRDKSIITHGLLGPGCVCGGV